MPLEALGEIVRSRILFVVACWLVFGTTWLGLPDALGQTPLRPAGPAVTSQEIPLRPDSVPTVPVEEAEKVLPAGTPQATQQVSLTPQVTDPSPAAVESAKTEKQSEATKLIEKAVPLAKPAMQDKKPAAGGLSLIHI